MKLFLCTKKRAALFALGTALAVVLCVLLSATGAYAVYYGGTLRKLPIYSVETEEKRIAITFDCAWGTEHTDAILEALAREEVPATFFMVQFWAEKYPEYVKKIADAGCEIGTHSATHSYMSRQSEEEIRAELRSSCAAIETVTGKAVELFRAPYGDYDDLLIETAQSMGLYTIQWDVDSLDWKDGMSATDISMRILNCVQAGSIILCHNNGAHTAEALPVVLDTLKNRGFTFVTVGELILRENYTIDANGRQHAAA